MALCLLYVWLPRQVHRGLQLSLRLDPDKLEEVAGRLKMLGGSFLQGGEMLSQVILHSHDPVAGRKPFKPREIPSLQDLYPRFVGIASGAVPPTSAGHLMHLLPGARRFKSPSCSVTRYSSPRAWQA